MSALTISRFSDYMAKNATSRFSGLLESAGNSEAAILTRVFSGVLGQNESEKTDDTCEDAYDYIFKIVLAPVVVQENDSCSELTRASSLFTLCFVINVDVQSVPVEITPEIMKTNPILLHFFFSFFFHIIHWDKDYKPFVLSINIHFDKTFEK